MVMNEINGKCYVGQAVDVRVRLRRHLGILRRGNHHCAHMQNSFSKHGETAFKFMMIEECSVDVLTEREQFWMDQHKATGLYNLSPAAGSPLGVKRSEETKAKIRAANLGNKLSAETRAKISAAHTGKKLSPETIARMSAAQSGKVISPEQREKQRHKMTGQKRTAETKAKQSLALRGKKNSPEGRANKVAAWILRRINYPTTKGHKNVFI